MKIYALTHDNKLDSVCFKTAEEAISYLENRIPKIAFQEPENWTWNYVTDSLHTWKLFELELAK